MTQGEDKKLLFIDLCSRLPYHVRLKIWLKDGTTEEGFLGFGTQLCRCVARYFLLRQDKRH